jgi:VRR-NUC domain
MARTTVTGRRPGRPRRQIPSEGQEQAAVLAWAWTHVDRLPGLALLYAVPNGARVSWSQAKKLKAEGLKAGVPDLHLPVARMGYHGLWIEMKRIKGGRLSESQRWWRDALCREGHLVACCAGAEQAITKLATYLSRGSA